MLLIAIQAWIFIISRWLICLFDEYNVYKLHEKPICIRIYETVSKEKKGNTVLSYLEQGGP